MKKTLSLLILFISLLSFGQEKEYGQAFNLFNIQKYEESLVIVDKLLNKEFGELSKELEIRSLRMRFYSYYRLKNYEKAYGFAISYLEIVKNSTNLFSDEYKKIAIDEVEKFIANIKSKISSEQAIASNAKTNNSDKQITESKSASDNNSVTLMVSGTGKTLEEAKLNALRSAIEQAFGAFISSKTEILNDSIVKDEVVSVTNGNIQKYDVISQVEIPDNGYAITLKAIVSIEKLTSFVENKGFSVEFKGGLFAFNVKQQILNEKNEIKAIEDLCNVVTKLSDASFEYSIKVSDPVAVNADNDKWRIPMYISVSANNNLFRIATYINQTLKGLSLSNDEANNYIKLGKKVYPISFAANEKEYNYILLRTEIGVSKLISQLYYFNHSIQNFKISDGLSEWKIIDYPNNLKYIYDYGFRIFIKKGNNGSDYNAYCKSSVFYTHCHNQFNCNVGRVLELQEVNDGNCGFRPILDYSQWIKTTTKWNGSSYANLTGVDINNFQTELTNNRSNVGSWNTAEVYFVDQFAFVKQLKDIIDSQPGLIISFIGIKPNEEIVRFYLEDIKSLEEINKISEYKVSPIVN